MTSVPSFTHGRSAAKSRSSRFGGFAPVSPWYELYLRYGFGRRMAHFNPMRRITLSTLLWLTRTPNSYTRHAHLPVAAPVGRAMEDLSDHRLDIRLGDRLGMRKEIVVGASRQSRDFQQAPERMAEPRQRRDDHRLLPVVGFDASRAGAFSDTRPSP